MAYQNVGTPRFYINVLEWLASNSAITLPSDHFRTLPVNPTLFTNIPAETPFSWLPFDSVFSKNCFFAFLGHTRANDHVVDSAYGGIDLYLDPGGAGTAFSNDIQINLDANYSVPQYDGFSLASLAGVEFFQMTLFAYGNVGSIILGTYYDMPHSPDLSLTMTREYGGTKTIETKGGASLSNTFYTKTPAWGDLGAWEIGGGDPKLSKSGRRVWDLSFSYLQDSDVFPDVSSLTNYETTEYNSNDVTLNTLLDGDDFYSQVIHKTRPDLPFIFQPDNSNNNPDQFAICKFDSGFKFEQVANGVYNVKLKIREVW